MRKLTSYPHPTNTMPRSFSHITPRYVFDRLGVILHEKIYPANPWLTAKSVELLTQLLKPSDVGVEFGSGRSTVWFAKHLRHLTSVEDNQIWYGKVKSLLRSNDLADKVDYRLLEDEAAYAQQAESFSNESIDFCLVDGIARDKCALGMLPKLKPGAILVIDNVNLYLPNDNSKSPNTRRKNEGGANDLWNTFLVNTQGWRQIWTSNGVTDTCIFFKP